MLWDFRGADILREDSGAGEIFKSATSLYREADSPVVFPQLCAHTVADHVVDATFALTGHINCIHTPQHAVRTNLCQCLRYKCWCRMPAVQVSGLRVSVRRSLQSSL